jgi:hypothetical protein
MIIPTLLLQKLRSYEIIKSQHYIKKTQNYKSNKKLQRSPLKQC